MIRIRKVKNFYPVEIMAKLEDNSKMQIGKHKGKAMWDVPDSYLMWFWGENSKKYKTNRGLFDPTTLDIMDYIFDSFENLP